MFVFRRRRVNITRKTVLPTYTDEMRFDYAAFGLDVDRFAENNRKTKKKIRSFDCYDIRAIGRRRVLRFFVALVPRIVVLAKNLFRVPSTLNNLILFCTFG